MKSCKQAKILALFASGDYYCLADGFVVSRKFGYPQIVSSRRNNQGYPLATMVGPSGRIDAAVHQIVYLFFRGGYEPHLQVNHIDGVKANNQLSNLELVTASENQKHAVRMGLFRDQRGPRNAMVKLTTRKVRKIRKLASEGVSGRQLAKQFHVTTGNISCILLYKTWRDV